MDYDILKNLLDRIEGCTFATLDSTTYPKKGLRCETKGTRVIMFTNKKVSGYGNMVKRRLEAAGKNPADFVLGDLPWGTRVPDSPLIEHKGVYYIQTIVLSPGESVYSVGGRQVNPSSFGINPRRTNQGIPQPDEVIVSTYKMESIDRIVLMGEEVVTAKPRSILRLNHG